MESHQNLRNLIESDDNLRKLIRVTRKSLRNLSKILEISQNLNSSPKSESLESRVCQNNQLIHPLRLVMMTMNHTLNTTGLDLAGSEFIQTKRLVNQFYSHSHMIQSHTYILHPQRANQPPRIPSESTATFNDPLPSHTTPKLNL